MNMIMNETRWIYVISKTDAGLPEGISSCLHTDIALPTRLLQPFWVGFRQTWKIRVPTNPPINNIIISNSSMIKYVCICIDTHTYIIHFIILPHPHLRPNSIPPWPLDRSSCPATGDIGWCSASGGHRSNVRGPGRWTPGSRYLSCSWAVHGWEVAGNMWGVRIGPTAIFQRTWAKRTEVWIEV